MKYRRGETIVKCPEKVFFNFWGHFTTQNSYNYPLLVDCNVGADQCVCPKFCGLCHPDLCGGISKKSAFFQSPSATSLLVPLAKRDSLFFLREDTPVYPIRLRTKYNISTMILNIFLQKNAISVKSYLNYY